MSRKINLFSVFYFEIFFWQVCCISWKITIIQPGEKNLKRMKAECQGLGAKGGVVWRSPVYGRTLYLVQGVWPEFGFQLSFYLVVISVTETSKVEKLNWSNKLYTDILKLYEENVYFQYRIVYDSKHQNFAFTCSNYTHRWQ